MSERLTDDDLKWMRHKATLDDADTDDLIELSEKALRAVAEIRDRRAADLSGDDMVALNGARIYLRDTVASVEPGWRKEAIEVLDRLLARKP
jgi:hypothetical protein